MSRVVLGVAVLTSLLSCSNAQRDGKADAGPPAPPIAVKTAAVEVRAMPRYLALTGSVAAEQHSEVAANVSGRVTATYVERGQAVKAGQVLAVVDSRAASFSAAAAQAQSQAAQTQVALATQECERADTLFKQGAMSRAEFDRAKSQCTAQLYQANAAQANAGLAGKLAGDTIIRSPIDGVVGERYVNVGEFVQPPSRVASVSAVDPVRVTISVPEPSVGQVKQGQAALLEVAAYPGRFFPAEVRFLSPSLRPTTRDLVIEATARNEDLALKPGMFATARLLVGEDTTATVPLEAVHRDGTTTRIYLSRGGKAYEVVVRTGVVHEGRVAIDEKLEATELVILGAPEGLRDGAKVQ